MVVGGYIELAAMSGSEARGKALNGAICFDGEHNPHRLLAVRGRSDASGDTVRLKGLAGTTAKFGRRPGRSVRARP
jgi:hypothetical protein